VPNRVVPRSTADSSDDTVVFGIDVTRTELSDMIHMVAERIDTEWELIEDLRALGRPYGLHVRRAGLAMRVLSRLDMTKARECGPSELI
jgi:hypothetical protein